MFSFDAYDMVKAEMVIRQHEGARQRLANLARRQRKGRSVTPTAQRRSAG